MSGNTRIMKGWILRRADEDLVVPSEEILDNLLNNQLWEAARARDVVEESDESHVKNDWFGSNWWPNVPLKQEVLRSAYVKAVQLALSGVPRPVVSLWICGAEDTFEAAVMDSPSQITVVLITPPHPKAQLPPEAATFPDSVYAVAPAASIEAVRNGYEGKYSLPDAEEPISSSGVKVQRLIGY